jgi:hypothetical protein
MNKILKFKKKKLILHIFVWLILAIMWVGFTGCFGSYGTVKRDPELTKSIENNEIIEGYKYYYYGYADKPHAVAAIDPKYEVRSKLWREVDPNSENEKYKKMIYWMWQDYGYYPYGAHILDPSGAKAGVWYSSIYFVTVKFTADNRIVLMPERPYLWGPTADDSGVDRFSGILK